jgi:hypothetical protein
MRQRITLAHELGHVLFEDWAVSDAGDWSERDPAEIRADAFARHLLIPLEGLRDFVGQRSAIAESRLSAVVQRFLVSPQIAAIALRDAGYIDEASKRDWMTLRTPQLAARFGWADQYHLLQATSDRRRAPQRLLARAIAGYVEGVLPAQAIATLRGINVEDLMEELTEAGVTPAERPVAWADPGELPEYSAIRCCGWLATAMPALANGSHSSAAARTALTSGRAYSDSRAGQARCARQSGDRCP